MQEKGRWKYDTLQKRLKESDSLHNIHFSSQTMLNKHAGQYIARARENVPTQTVPEPMQIKRIRPLRIAARRNGEHMKIITGREDAHSDDVEWLDKDEVYLSAMSSRK
ncbi:hypothetical protein DPMN_008439 [Dreissena polymorpha]|uniref:Uncharacterized protein n=1 Tax=Dreissena polymorpha TaxID=45954 RepID=A0A9D4RXB8_DREPO|nr:hypothetical protein DPMN_008439 [Dreissena polymorpha]